MKSYAEHKANDQVFITVPVRIEFEKIIRLNAAKMGISRAKFVRQAIDAYLDNLGRVEANNETTN